VEVKLDAEEIREASASDGPAPQANCRPPVILMIRLSLFLTCPGALSSRILSQIIDAGSILSGIILEIASVCALGF